MEGSTEYPAIPKGRGFVYAYDSQLYRQVKNVGRVRYLKCTIAHFDGSAKLTVITNGCPLCRTPIDMVMHVYM